MIYNNQTRFVTQNLKQKKKTEKETKENDKVTSRKVVVTIGF
jgi:hypothetical protein